jgi:alpha-glucoside transport system permease protein
MATVEALERIPGRRESVAARILRVLAKTPVHFVLVFVALLWLVPTLGLFLTSLLSAEAYLEGGWWQIVSAPSKLTFDNYSAIFDNATITSSLVTTVWIAVGGTALPIIVAAALDGADQVI